MSLTVQEAIAVNVVVKRLLNIRERHDPAPPTNLQVEDACRLLVTKAHAKLYAGLHPDDLTRCFRKPAAAPTERRS
jgi:hypothetical protein